MKLHDRNLIEPLSLAGSLLCPGLLLFGGTNSGSTFFLALVLQYALGAAMGVVLYRSRSLRA